MFEEVKSILVHESYGSNYLRMLIMHCWWCSRKTRNSKI